MDQVRDITGKPEQAAPGGADWLNVLETGRGRRWIDAYARRLCSGPSTAARSNGGGTVFVPAGKYVTGTLWLRSNIILHLDAGAMIQGETNARLIRFG